MKFTFTFDWTLLQGLTEQEMMSHKVTDNKSPITVTQLFSFILCI